MKNTEWCDHELYMRAFVARIFLIYCYFKHEPGDENSASILSNNQFNTCLENLKQPRVPSGREPGACHHCPRHSINL